MPIQFPSRPSTPGPADPDPVDDVPAAAAPGAAHATAHLRGDTGNMSDPGVRVRLDAAGILPGGIPGSGAFRAANLAHTLSNASGSAGLDVQVTHALPGNRPAEDRGTVTAAVRAGAVARTETAGVDRLLGVMDQGAKVQKSAEKLYEDVRKIQTSLAGSKDVARLKEIAAAAGTRRLTPAEMLEANTLAGSIEAQLRSASNVLGQAAPVLDEIEGLVGGLGDGALSATGSAAGGAFLEERLGFRTPALRVGDHRFDASLGVNLVQPGKIPAEARAQMGALDDAVALRSSMVAVRAYVNVTVSGLAEVKGAIDGIRGDISKVRGTVDAGANRLGAVRTNPLSALTEADKIAKDADQLATDLTTQGEALGKRADALVKGLDVKIDSGLVVSQPSGSLGAGVNDASVRWRYDPNQNFQVAVRAYVENVGGYLPGTRDRYAIDPDAGKLTPLSSEKANVYSDFFPRTFGADVAVSAGRAGNARTDVLAGVSTDGSRVSAHLGLVQQIGRRFLVRLGVVDPDVTRSVNHTLLPTAGVDLRLGPRLDPGKVTLGLNGGAALNLGGPGKGPELSGGQAGIGLTIHF